MLRFFSALVILLGLSNRFFGQEQLGLRLERFSGISSANLNPANLSGMALKWDINLAGAAFFVESNYGFIHDASVPKVLRTPPDTTHFYVTSYAVNAPKPIPGQVIIDFADRNRKYYGEMRFLAMLPAFAVHLGDQNTVGFSTEMHVDAMTHTVPASLGYPRYDAHPRYSEFELGQISAAAMAWSEAALHFSRKTELENGSLAIGGSLRFLMAHEALFARSEGSFGLTKIQGDSLIFRDIEFEGGVTTSNFPTFLDKKPRFAVNGTGLGVNLGFVFTQGSDDLEDGDYPWKFGASIIDIGQIAIRKNAERHTFFQDSSFVLDPNDLTFFTDPHEPIKIGSARAFNGDSLASLAGSKFAVKLPLAICLQGDFRAISNFYINGTFIQRIDFRKAAIQRPNILAVTPRFEQRWWSASVPLILSEYQSFRFGLAARLGFLTLGTDDLGSYFRQKKLNSTDFYIALKINAFRFWGENAREKRRIGRKSRVKCYEF